MLIRVTLNGAKGNVSTIVDATASDYDLLMRLAATFGPGDGNIPGMALSIGPNPNGHPDLRKQPPPPQPALEGQP